MKTLMLLFTVLLIIGVLVPVIWFPDQAKPRLNEETPSVTEPTPSPIEAKPSLNETKPSVMDPGFLFGVTFGGNTVSQAKTMIDKVKAYTNLFIVDSWDISGAPNSTNLDEICDYAVNANLSVMVYFSFIYYNSTSQISNLYNSSTWELYGYTPWHISWLDNARERWGDKFLGAYLYDEPGGKMIDTGYWLGNITTTFAGTRITSFDNLTDYSDAANRFTTGRQGIRRSGSAQRLTNTSLAGAVNKSVPLFTSDYALYWFDYLAGYDAVFTELGGTRGVGNKVQQIALCRGAANVQGKQWGAIITWTYNDPPYIGDPQNMLEDMKMAYGAGAKYLLVFDYPFPADSPYGILTDEHLTAMQTFWNTIQASPRSSFGEMKGEVAFLLPKDYGWGMRTPEDRIWGFWGPDNSSTLIWNNMMFLLNKYGPKLDIIYDDSNFSYQQKYSTIYLWNSTNIT